MRKYMLEHLGLEQELGYCSLDALLDAVASGKEWPVTAPLPPCGPALCRRMPTPGGDATTVSVPPVALGTRPAPNLPSPPHFLIILLINHIYA